MTSVTVKPSDVQSAVCVVTAKALNLTSVSPEDNFFELGLTSVTAVRIVAELRTTFHVEIPLVNVFEMPELAVFSESVFELIEEARER
jgi:nonribosomal peptide synthetase DhbF